MVLFSSLIKNKFLEVLSIILIALIFSFGFIEFEEINQLIQYEKHYYLSLVIFCFSLLWVVSAKKIYVSHIDILVFIYFTYVLILNIFNSNQFEFLSYFFLLFLYLSSRLFFQNSDQNLKFILFVVIASIFSAYSFHGLLQFFDFALPTNSINKVSGYYFNPAPYAGWIFYGC